MGCIHSDNRCGEFSAATCNTAQKDDFSESSMNLIALPGNEMKRPCSLETDCSLSGQDRWTGRRKRQEKFDKG